jgi:hypothetical protein
MAQTRPLFSRPFVSINGAVQTATGGFADRITFTENAENGSLDTDYVVGGGPAFDVAGGAFWRELGIGVGVTRFSHSTPGSVSARVPHPVFFNQNRAVNGSVAGLQRKELAIHLRASTMIPVWRVQVLAFGGPSFFRVTQGIVTDIDYTEEYPYDAAVFTRSTTTEAKASKVGFNAGADVAYFFTRQLGVGGVVQFARATVEFAAAGGEPRDVNAGGLQAGGGLRVRF